MHLNLKKKNIGEDGAYNLPLNNVRTEFPWVKLLLFEADNEIKNQQRQ
jgi:hypothetical protein